MNITDQITASVPENFYHTELVGVPVVITRTFKQGENPEHIRATGDILRRTCIARMGVTACEECVFFDDENYPQDAAEAKVCSDRNLQSALQEQGISPEATLMVAVTGNGVGFYDSLKPETVTQSKYGWDEVAGYNAFFAKRSEGVSLGSRMADCGHVALQADLPNGDEMIGFVHLTLTNMEGAGAESFEVDGEPATYIAYAVDQAAKHYGVPKEAIRAKLTAAISTLNYKFSSKEGEPAPEQKMDQTFKGWFDQNLLANTSNPNWKRGDAIEPTDEWVADYHGMCEYLLGTAGLTIQNVDLAEIIDPADQSLGHASNAAGKHGKLPEARDLYLVKS